MQHEQIQLFEEYLYQRRYSINTIKIYKESFKIFVEFISPKELAEVTNEDLERFNYERIIRRGLSASYQNQVINALKLYYRRFHNMHFDVDSIERPKEGNKLPIILSPNEVEQIIQSTRNIKHKTMLMLIYSCGLRRSELLALRIRHIDSKRMLIHIEKSKGNKDRLVPLSPKMLDELRIYYKAYKPQNFLFEGERGGSYGPTSLQKVLKRSVQRANILKRVTLHTLRHSYATHMLEAGVNLRYIQEILGHRSSRTTEIYTHVQSNDLTKLINPLDKLNV